MQVSLAEAAARVVLRRRATGNTEEPLAIVSTAPEARATNPPACRCGFTACGSLTIEAHLRRYQHLTNGVHGLPTLTRSMSGVRRARPEPATEPAQLASPDADPDERLTKRRSLPRLRSPAVPTPPAPLEASPADAHPLVAPPVEPPARLPAPVRKRRPQSRGAALLAQSADLSPWRTSRGTVRGASLLAVAASSRPKRSNGARPVTRGDALIAFAQAASLPIKPPPAAVQPMQKKAAGRR
jgi:hypothetical protein